MCAAHDDETPHTPTEDEWLDSYTDEDFEALVKAVLETLIKEAEDGDR